MNALTTIIATLDEQVHIRRAVESVKALGPVVVVDAGSVDGTQRMAAEAGATVVEHRWEGYSAQKNWALENLGLDSGWVLFLDADEYLTPDLRREITGAIESNMYEGFYIPRQNIFLGRLLRHAWWYPDYQLRLFKVGKGRYENRLVHEHVLIDGSKGFLKQPLLHENLKGIDAFVQRHLRYATLEAAERLKSCRQSSSDQMQGSFFGSWPERRRALKIKVWYRLPARPLVRFFWMYFVRRGFLDGKQGRIYCQLIASHEALINAKVLELESIERRTSEMTLSTLNLQSLLVCPRCRASLTWSSEDAWCEKCERSYSIKDGIPILLESRTRRGHVGSQIDIHNGSKLDQIRYFDQDQNTDFEITRPHGAPRLHRWLLAEKFRRSVTGLKPMLRGSVALSVCGGSGMDAEFLARSGASVILADISLGAARRARERARRYGLAIMPIVADAERLPFADRAVELVYVHDGLHHLEEPRIGLGEMARVARRAVSVTEPAQAAITALAVRVGLALEREEAGNRVVRLTQQEVEAVLRAYGFRIIDAGRYGMYYRHEPGRVSRWLSVPLLLPFATAGLRALNRFAGRLGNKLNVQAVRRDGKTET